MTVAETGEVRVGPRRTPDRQVGTAPTKYIRAANIALNGLQLADVLRMDFSEQEAEEYKLEPGDLLIAEASGSPKHVGRAALWEGQISDCCYQNSVIRYRSKVTHPSYTLAVFRHYAASGTFARVARGVNILHLGVGRFERMPFPLPPYAEQVRIARELQTRSRELDEAEARLRSAASKISSQVAEILAMAASGQFVARESTADGGMATETASDTATPVEALYEIPRSWNWVRVDAVGEVSIGRQRHNRDSETSFTAPYLRVLNVQEGYIDTTDVLEMPFEEREYQRYLLKSGDVLLNEGQSPELVGRAAIFRDELQGTCFQNSLIRFRASDLVLPEYALLIFRYYLHSGEFKKVARWTTNIAHLSLNRFAAMPFPLPPLSQQEQIVSEALGRLSAAHEQKTSVSSSLENVARMRDELYAAATNGSLSDQRPDDESPTDSLSRVAADKRRAHDHRSRAGSVVRPVEIRADRNAAEGSMGMDMEPVNDTGPTLAAAIVAAGRPVTLAELYLLCGYDKDSVADIERFYLRLKNELGESINQHSGQGEEIYLEAVEGATA